MEALITLIFFGIFVGNIICFIKWSIDKMRFKRATKLIRLGMQMEEVEDIMRDFKVSERDYNRHNELVVVYKIKLVLSKDYESTAVVYDESGQVADVSKAYHRTRYRTR